MLEHAVITIGSKSLLVKLKIKFEIKVSFLKK